MKFSQSVACPQVIKKSVCQRRRWKRAYENYLQKKKTFVKESESFPSRCAFCKLVINSPLLSVLLPCDSQDSSSPIQGLSTCCEVVFIIKALRKTKVKNLLSHLETDDAKPFNVSQYAHGERTYNNIRTVFTLFLMRMVTYCT